jgi:hypothetical protein
LCIKTHPSLDVSCVQFAAKKWSLREYCEMAYAREAGFDTVRFEFGSTRLRSKKYGIQKRFYQLP